MQITAVSTVCTFPGELENGRTVVQKEPTCALFVRVYVGELINGCTHHATTLQPIGSEVSRSDNPFRWKRYLPTGPSTNRARATRKPVVSTRVVTHCAPFVGIAGHIPMEEARLAEDSPARRHPLADLPRGKRFWFVLWHVNLRHLAFF